ncbi:MAG: phytanoyl-CoA dioxygenase family protein [Gammaproteobacteria bacterium]|nr:phytanoyl-CoA dioxygenase family protein [Gammaproteobacteria bacterium]
MPDLAVPGEVVSKAEMDFFMKNGFFVKKGLLDPLKLAPALDQIWAHLLERVPVLEGSGWELSREDSATWMNPQWAPMPPHPTSGPYQGRQPIEHMGRIVKLHDVGDADYLLDLLPNDQSVRAVAEVLLGEDLRPSVRMRGVYAVFPTKDPADPSGKRRLSGASLGPHTDQVCQQLNAAAYLDDVSPRSGGFTVYPGSHKRMFQAHEYESNWSPLPSYHDVMNKVVEDIEPYELVAEKGSVIFWHGRTVHSAGIHTGSSIRWALFADFTHNREVMSDEEHRDLGQFEWFKDAKLFRDDWPVSVDDMWRNWSLRKGRKVEKYTDPKR